MLLLIKFYIHMQQRANKSTEKISNSKESTLNKLKIDLIVIGNPNSGKTSLIRRFIDGETSFSHFYTPTLGLSLEKRIIKIDNNQITVCIWDTAGQQKFFSLTKNYFKKADGVLVVFDLTDKNSFERIQKYWIHQVKQKSDEDCSSILVGNKMDIKQERAIQYEQAIQLSKSLDIPYFQTSAKTGENVQKAINSLVKQCLAKVKDSEPRGVDTNINLNNNNSSGISASCFASSKQFFSGVLDKFRN